MKLVAASSLTDAELAQVRQIYFDGFAPHLRAPVENLLADTALVLVDSKPLGLAVLRVLAETGWVYLRYFAVGEKGRGLGGRLWAHLRDEMTGAGHTRIIFDVEDPAQPGISAAEELIRHRRIAFYRRLGAEVLPVRGFLPPQGSAGHPMLLMAADHVPNTPPAAEDSRRIVLAVYEHRYGMTAADPVVAETLRLSGLAAAPSRPSGTR
ncbi:GNAT family N-acetyltransferase [Lentzea flava]|uniref:GNAT family N-acetyltransferase n=1 Tax=Lentzea flava TaxID=103732 RepID=UPI001E2ACE1F|nr:GNAT family N-acetyltransferase [Lentzea flava]